MDNNNELKVFRRKDVEVVDSRAVAEMLGKPHNDLMKSIRSYRSILGQGDFSQSNFFIPDTYTNTQNKRQPCYLLTKKGCDMVANKMTGEKGVLFTAAYVTAFEKMREQVTKQKPMTDYQQHSIAIQKARLLNQIASEYDGTYRQVLQAHATKELTGEFLLPLPRIEQLTYSAGEIGEQLGISGNKVGILTNRHKLKTEQYGAWFADTAKGHHKQVQTFRYYPTIIPVLRDILTEGVEDA